MFTCKIWFFMTLILFAQSQTTETLHCPVGRPCMCILDSPDIVPDQSINIISCKNHHLRKVPTLNTTGDSKDYQKIDFSLNSLHEIPDDYFQEVSGLEEIRLTLNALVSIPNAVRSLSSLKRLYFGKNLLRFSQQVNGSIFEGMSSLKFVDLQGNRIETLYAGSFKGLTSLTSMFLFGNEIVEIKQGVWEDLPNIEVLDLSGNHITRINETDFLGLSQLQSLNLTSNKLTYIVPNSFREMENLIILDLSDNKIAGYLLSGTFNGLPNLHYLYLGQNLIHGLAPGVFENLDSIDLIDLFHNYIEDINVDSFGNSSYSLTSLMLGLNDMVGFPDGFFEHFPQLNTLSLLALPITEVPNIRSLSKLEFLSLSYTKVTDAYPCDLERLEKLTTMFWSNALLNCNCNAKWLKQWYENMLSDTHRSLIESTEHLNWKCNSPPSFKGKAFHQLHVEDLTCNEGKEAKWCHGRYAPILPTELSITDIRSGTVKVEWNISTQIIPKIAHVYLSVYPDTEKSADAEMVKYEVEKNNTDYEVKNLSPGKTYNICLTLVQEHGIELATHCIEVDITMPTVAPVTLPHGILAICVISGLVLLAICAVLLYVFCRKFRIIRGHYSHKNGLSPDGEQVELPSGIVLFDPALDETKIGVGR